jgi:hypothetical protein
MPETLLEASRTASESSAECRICGAGSEAGRLHLSLCNCVGSVAPVHERCIENWIAQRPQRGSSAMRCEICGAAYRIDTANAVVYDCRHMCLNAHSCRHCTDFLTLGATSACMLFAAKTVFIDRPDAMSDDARAFMVVALAVTFVLSGVTMRKAYLRWRLSSSEEVLRFRQSTRAGEPRVHAVAADAV